MSALIPPADTGAAPAVGSAPAPCPIAEEVRPWTAPADLAPPGLAAHGANDYRHRLRPTPAGWPRRSAWCVWLEPADDTGPGARWEQRWWRAVNAAVTSWRQQLPLSLVTDPERAQVLVLRRRPPLLNQRASHGRSLLELLQVQRAGLWRLEPHVTVLIGPGQAEPALQATALHELGHAFGLWGHSDQPGDAMAAQPGPQPVLQLSARDRATLGWLQAQPELRQDLLPRPDR